MLRVGTGSTNLTDDIHRPRVKLFIDCGPICLYVRFFKITLLELVGQCQKCQRWQEAFLFKKGML